MVFLNRFDSTLTGKITFDLYFDAQIPVGEYHFKDLWTQENEGDVVVGNAGSNFSVENVEPHAVVALRFDIK